MEDKETIISKRTFKMKGVKRMFKVRMAKNFPHLMKMTNPKIQQAEQCQILTQLSAPHSSFCSQQGSPGVGCLQNAVLGSFSRYLPSGFHQEGALVPNHKQKEGNSRSSSLTPALLFFLLLATSPWAQHLQSSSPTIPGMVAPLSSPPRFWQHNLLPLVP